MTLAFSAYSQFDRTLRRWSGLRQLIPFKLRRKSSTKCTFENLRHSCEGSKEMIKSFYGWSKLTRWLNSSQGASRCWVGSKMGPSFNFLDCWIRITSLCKKVASDLTVPNRLEIMNCQRAFNIFLSIFFHFEGHGGLIFCRRKKIIGVIRVLGKTKEVFTLPSLFPTRLLIFFLFFAWRINKVCS